MLFFLIMFYTAAASMLMIGGMCAFLSKKPIGNPALLQKALGAAMVLLAIDAMAFACSLRFGTSALAAALIAAANVAPAAWFAWKIYERMDESGQTSGEYETAASHEETPDLDEVEPLCNPSVDDMMFFQRVESVMVNKRLFCQQEISREQVAMEIGTNRTYLARSIKGATGMTFQEYITSLRTAYAATLLTTTDAPSGEVGAMAGFRSKSSYYRAFLAAYGCPPNEYRSKRPSCEEKKDIG